MIAVLRCLVAAVVVMVAAGGCSDVDVEATADSRSDRLRDELSADVGPEVADCVVRLADHDLQTGDLDPIVADELALNCQRAHDIIDEAAAADDSADGTDPDGLAFVDGPSTLGDDPDLDRLWQACADGSGRACDDLFEQSPVGSDYEQFGVSCGRRDDVLNCSELDATDVDGAEVDPADVDDTGADSADVAITDVDATDGADPEDSRTTGSWASINVD